MNCLKRLLINVMVIDILYVVHSAIISNFIKYQWPIFNFSKCNDTIKILMESIWISCHTRVNIFGILSAIHFTANDISNFEKIYTVVSMESRRGKFSLLGCPSYCWSKAAYPTYSNFLMICSTLGNRHSLQHALQGKAQVPLEPSSIDRKVSYLISDLQHSLHNPILLQKASNIAIFIFFDTSPSSLCIGTRDCKSVIFSHSSVPTSKFCQNSIVAGGTEVRNNKDGKGLNASVSSIHTVSISFT